jgi:hypothetical protein
MPGIIGIEFYMFSLVNQVRTPGKVWGGEIAHLNKLNTSRTPLQRRV